MARIVGVDLPRNKRGEIGLTYIYGVGRNIAKKVLDEAGVDRNAKVQDWTDDQINTIRRILNENYKLEGELRSETQMNIKRLMDIGCYRGVRHRIGLPLEDKVPRITPEPEKGERRLLQIRKKLLNK